MQVRIKIFFFTARCYQGQRALSLPWDIWFLPALLSTISVCYTLVFHSKQTKGVLINTEIFCYIYIFFFKFVIHFDHCKSVPSVAFSGSASRWRYSHPFCRKLFPFQSQGSHTWLWNVSHTSKSSQIDSKPFSPAGLTKIVCIIVSSCLFWMGENTLCALWIVNIMVSVCWFSDVDLLRVEWQR